MSKVNSMLDEGFVIFLVLFNGKYGRYLTHSRTHRHFGTWIHDDAGRMTVGCV